MSYSLGQAKLVPGQINFMTTRTGRTMSLQPLVEAGLPLAPYVEHGSWEFGQPAIMRYGLDPYRGISGADRVRPPAPTALGAWSAGKVALVTVAAVGILGLYTFARIRMTKRLQKEMGYGGALAADTAVSLGLGLGLGT